MGHLGVIRATFGFRLRVLPPKSTPGPPFWTLQEVRGDLSAPFYPRTPPFWAEEVPFTPPGPPNEPSTPPRQTGKGCTGRHSTRLKTTYGAEHPYVEQIPLHIAPTSHAEACFTDS